MAGFGEAAAAASFVSLTVQLFDGCVKGFVLLQDAQGLGSRADFLSCQLEWEQCQLSTWANAVGLLKDPPELNVSNRANVQTTLTNLEQLLTDTQKIKKEYGLHIEITEEELQDVQLSKSVLGKLFSRKKQRFVSDSATVYSRRNNAWKKVKWAAFDAVKLRLLLSDIHDLNDRLQSLLHPADQLANAQIHDGVMRSVVANSTNTGMSDAMSGPLKSVDGAIAASARLRQQGFVLDLIPIPEQEKGGVRRKDQPSPNSSRQIGLSETGSVKSLRVALKHLSKCCGHSMTDIHRENALLEGKPVLAEWKDITNALEPKLKYRIANVASFLSEMHDPSFHSLRCLGYVKGSSVRYGYLFEYPASNSYRTLSQLLNNTSLRPSLNTRMSLGLALAETVLQLHTAGWLHKAISPENVLVFKDCNADWKEHVLQWQIYLGGYTFARADNPLEATEDPTSRDYAEVYRHPSSLLRDRVAYNKGSDLYSLGCVLIELALWKTLPSILWQRMFELNLVDSSSLLEDPFSDTLQQAQPKSQPKENLLRHREDLLSDIGSLSIHADLEFCVGAAYCKIVGDCLSHADDSLHMEDDLDSSIDIQEQVTAMLRKLTDTI